MVATAREGDVLTHLLEAGHHHALRVLPDRQRHAPARHLRRSKKSAE